MVEGLYILKSRVFFFLVRVNKLYPEGDYAVKVSPVSKRDGEQIITENDCLTVEITLSFSEYSAMVDYVGFHEGCSLFEPMERGFGTQEMVKATLSLCRNLFGISKFTFHDASKFDCLPTGGEVNLDVHNLLVYGKSWYERKFGAKPSSHAESLRWERSKQLLASVVDQEKATRVNRDIGVFFQGEHRDSFLEVVNDALVDRITWNQVFENMNLSHNGCVFFTGGMIDSVIDMFDIHRVESWYIPLTDDDVTAYLVAHEKIVD